MRRKPLPRPPAVALTLRRRPRLRTALVVALGGLSGTVAAATVHDADQARAEWGRSTTVLVAARDLVAGERLDGSNTRLEQHPAPLVPRAALAAVPDDGRVREPVYEGEVLRAERLAPRGVSAVAARLPEGTLAVAVPAEPGTTPPLAVGDRVDVLVALPAEAAGGGPPGFELATAVVVVDITEAAVTIAVPRDVAPRLAVAFGQGAVTLALAG